MDINVINHGSVVQFMPTSPAGREFMQNEVQSEGWQWLGKTLCVDWRMAESLAVAMVAAGLELMEVSR